MTPYNSDFSPPAPVLEVSVRSSARARPRVKLPALLDTGADITAIPVTLRESLKLYQVGWIQMDVVGGQEVIFPTYEVDLILSGHSIPQVEAILTDFDFVVLGRDVLANYYLLLNGPEETFDLKTEPFKAGP